MLCHRQHVSCPHCAAAISSALLLQAVGLCLNRGPIAGNNWNLAQVCLLYIGPMYPRQGEPHLLLHHTATVLATAPDSGSIGNTSSAAEPAATASAAVAEDVLVPGGLHIGAPAVAQYWCLLCLLSQLLSVATGVMIVTLRCCCVSCRWSCQEGPLDRLCWTNQQTVQLGSSACRWASACVLYTSGVSPHLASFGTSSCQHTLFSLHTAASIPSHLPCVASTPWPV